MIDTYASWLERSGWTVQREVNFADIYACALKAYSYRAIFLSSKRSKARPN